MARQQAERLHGHLVGAELLGRHVLLELLHDERLEVLALGDIALDFVQEGDLAQCGEDLLETTLVANDGLGELALIGQAIALGEQFLPARTGASAASSPSAVRTEAVNRTRLMMSEKAGKGRISISLSMATQGEQERSWISSRRSGCVRRRGLGPSIRGGALRPVLAGGRIASSGEGNLHFMRAARAAHTRTSSRSRGPFRVWIFGSRSAERKLRITASGGRAGGSSWPEPPGNRRSSTSPAPARS